VRCWISSRDVEPGENYQEAIVRAIRDARALVLVFSDAANSSDEIKKELSLSSRYRVPVLALRIADVEPSDAFAYELSTRQWIDAFQGWDKSIAALAGRLKQIAATPGEAPPETVARPRRARVGSRAGIAAIGIVAAIFVIAAGLWLWQRPGEAPAQGLQVRLAGFQALSGNLPVTLPDGIRDELIAAFGDDGVVRVSTAPKASAGSAPAYALAGTVSRDGDKVKVISRLINERNGSTLWSNSATYGAAEIARLPRRVAVDTSTVIRCGLFGASTYRKGLPEPAFIDYFQACQNLGAEPDKSLDFARKVVAAVPDFSWGWSALETAAFYAILQRPPESRLAELRREALEAADKAIRLDPSNSEAYAYKSHLIDDADLAGRESLLQKAVKARTLPCGCEHHFYGDFLAEVGRLTDSVPEFRRSIDIMALNSNSQLSLAQVYFALNRADLAKEPLAAALELDMDPRLPGQLKVGLAPTTGDYSGAIQAINDPEGGAPPPIRTALTRAFEALRSKDPGAKREAIAGLQAMPAPARGGTYASLLAALGANREALDAVVAASTDPRRAGARSWLFTRPFATALRDPSFPAVATKLGLIQYWKTTRSKPDACLEKAPPPFCKLI
jgi:tetratricopeptide (TPR) repeat protein